MQNIQILCVMDYGARKVHFLRVDTCTCGKLAEAGLFEQQKIKLADQVTNGAATAGECDTMRAKKDSIIYHGGTFIL